MIKKLEVENDFAWGSNVSLTSSPTSIITFGPPSRKEIASHENFVKNDFSKKKLKI